MLRFKLPTKILLLVSVATGSFVLYLLSQSASQPDEVREVRPSAPVEVREARPSAPSDSSRSLPIETKDSSERATSGTTLHAPAPDGSEEPWEGLRTESESGRNAALAAVFFGVQDSGPMEDPAKEPPVKNYDFLDDKTREIMEFFMKESVTSIEWAEAYQTDVCGCTTRDCVAKAQDDFIKHAPPRSDKKDHESVRAAMASSAECIRNIVSD